MLNTLRKIMICVIFALVIFSSQRPVSSSKIREKVVNVTHICVQPYIDYYRGRGVIKRSVLSNNPSK